MSSNWQEEVAVVIAAHGDRGGEAPNRLLVSHADRLARCGRFRFVAPGVLKGEPALEAALLAAAASGAGRIAVYPFFMSDGYFTRTVLPERIRAAGLDREVVQLPPFGLDPAVPPLLDRLARGEAGRAGLEISGTRLLIVGHGSQFGPASAEATRKAAEAVGGLGGWAGVEAAYLEEPPYPAEALRGSPLPAVVAGFFAGDGMHAGEDVPEAIQDSGVRAVYAGSAGADAEVVSLIEAAVAAQLAP